MGEIGRIGRIAHQFGTAIGTMNFTRTLFGTILVQGPVSPR